MNHLVSWLGLGPCGESRLRKSLCQTMLMDRQGALAYSVRLLCLSTQWSYKWLTVSFAEQQHGFVIWCSGWHVNQWLLSSTLSPFVLWRAITADCEHEQNRIMSCTVYEWWSLCLSIDGMRQYQAFVAHLCFFATWQFPSGMSSALWNKALNCRGKYILALEASRQQRFQSPGPVYHSHCSSCWRAVQKPQASIIHSTPWTIWRSSGHWSAIRQTRWIHWMLAAHCCWNSAGSLSA